ncbi:hypothetical protein [Comamonas serinivorans]|uniref:hypothetical protein n=1 Tax=Comamonas serinivorans TaxID=1082851 RepID=UPI0012FC06BA|nr:hypothetical protein [Comamonas serinivorans]
MKFLLRSMWWVSGLMLTCSATAGQGPDPSYVKRLQTKYGHRLEFSGAHSRQTVLDFNIDCRAKDGRYLPLENVLLAKLASLERNDMWLITKVKSRGNDVWIYDQLMRRDGKVVHSHVAFEINHWGELRSPNGKLEALRNACFGSYGPIWKLPVATHTADTPSQTPTGQDKVLIDRAEFLHGRCRGGSGDEARTMAICEQRDKVIEQVQQRGWCWGPEDASQPERHWIRCR